LGGVSGLSKSGASYQPQASAVLQILLPNVHVHGRGLRATLAESGIHPASEQTMKMHRSPQHWIWVALVLAAFLLTVSLAHGQNTGSAAVFQGRPAMAGAQAGLGAQAGPPQGGLGVQGSEAAERSLRKPANAAPDMPQGQPAAPATVQTEKDVVRKKDPGIAKDERSAVKKTKRAAKRVVQRARHGVSEIDAYDNAGR
jgi:hypothetical protein